MKAVIQRVKSAGVRVEGKEVSSIGKGLVLLVCVEKEDDEKVVEWFAKKVVSLRIFADSEGKFNLSLRDVGGEVLLVSNFTVCGFLKKGTRPSFHLAADPEKAEASLQLLKEKIEALRKNCRIFLVSADTGGTLKEVAGELGIEGINIASLQAENEAEAKLKVLKELRKKFPEEKLVAIGNGRNDELILKNADLGICVIGDEGAWSGSILSAKVVVKKITDALDLLLKEKRLTATLRI